MAELKRLAIDAIPSALEKAERYRLLNEPAEAESICLDVLAVAPDNQQALITLVLALTDRFGKGYGVSDTQASELIARMTEEYDRSYFRGILAERRAKALLARGTPGCAHAAYEGFREAMHWFEQAETMRPENNDDAVLRWNTCARMIEKNQLSAREEDEFEPALE